MLAALATSCVVEDEDLSEVSSAIGKPNPGGCDDYGCGMSVPIMDGVAFTTLHEQGLENPERLRIKGFRAFVNGKLVSVVPDVLNGELLARDPYGKIVLKGAQLVNAEFLIDNAGTNEQHRVIVSTAEQRYMWSSKYPSTGTIPQTWDYKFSYISNIDGSTVDLCRAAAPPPWTQSADGHRMMLIDDERINAETLVVENQKEANWFMLGCPYSPLARLHLSGHTKAGSVLIGVPSTIQERTTALKMFTADYCGSGDPFTASNIPIRFGTRDLRNRYFKQFDVVEAHWNSQGAICLNNPRALGNPALPNLVAEITARCPLPPPCTVWTILTGFLGYDFQGAYMMSAHPTVGAPL